MSGQSLGELCILCKRGRVIEREEEIAFRQWTDKGYVHCRVNVRMQVCVECRFKTWDIQADTALDDAVRQEYDKLA